MTNYYPKIKLIVEHPGEQTRLELELPADQTCGEFANSLRVVMSFVGYLPETIDEYIPVANLDS